RAAVELEEHVAFRPRHGELDARGRAAVANVELHREPSGDGAGDRRTAEGAIPEVLERLRERLEVEGVGRRTADHRAFDFVPQAIEQKLDVGTRERVVVQN